MDNHYAYDHADRYSRHAEMDVADADRRTIIVSAEGSARTAKTATVEFGSGWYHDAAIEDASEAHANPYR